MSLQNHIEKQTKIFGKIFRVLPSFTQIRLTPDFQFGQMCLIRLWKPVKKNGKIILTENVWDKKIFFSSMNCDKIPLFRVLQSFAKIYLTPDLRFLEKYVSLDVEIVTMNNNFSIQTCSFYLCT